MRFVLYTNALSEHQMPLAREIVKRIGPENFRYVYTGVSSQKFQESVATDAWIAHAEVHPWLEEADEMLVGGLRPISLLERRAVRGLKTYFQSERWFKPFHGLPGWVRMLVPNYRRMVKRFVKWANTDPGATVLAIGPWAKRDFLRMGVKPEKLVDWGYFVAPCATKELKCEVEVEQRNVSSSLQLGLGTSTRTLKVLWAGRDIPLKHVRDIEKAVALANKNITTAVQLNTSTSTISSPITFTKLTGVSPAEVREAMRSHDTFVFASNAMEGWGAVVSEALEEGLNVICSSSCGAGPALLPPERLFKCGDVKMLARLLEKEYNNELPPCEIGDWTAKKAAERVFSL